MAISLREADRAALSASAIGGGPDHLAFFVLDLVAELELDASYAIYRDDGRGGAAYDPAVTLAVLLFASCVGERCPRRSERRLREDVAFGDAAANQQLDHATLACFCRRHANAIAEVVSRVLVLCIKEGLVDAAIVSIDGTKLEANASALANRTRRSSRRRSSPRLTQPTAPRTRVRRRPR
jgi:transposase